MKIGFIGCGNMASAMIKGIIKSKLVKPSDIIASNKSQPKLLALAKKCKIATGTNKEVAKASDILFIAVKPIFYADVIKEVASSVNSKTIIVSIAPGIKMASLEEMFGKKIKLVRSMPNTPALVGEGMSGLCMNDNVTPDEFATVKSIFESFGKAEEIPERIMDSVVAVSGSSPAYVYMFIEALADGAVLEGMPRAQAYKFAAQAVLGSAKMVLETGIQPGELKDAVCSPGGTTIEAVRVLEEKGMRSAVIEAVKACARKSEELGK